MIRITTQYIELQEIFKQVHIYYSGFLYIDIRTDFPKSGRLLLINTTVMLGMTFCDFQNCLFKLGISPALHPFISIRPSVYEAYANTVTIVNTLLTFFQM